MNNNNPYNIANFLDYHRTAHSCGLCDWKQIVAVNLHQSNNTKKFSLPQHV